jgi:hypothetical protein
VRAIILSYYHSLAACGPLLLVFFPRDRGFASKPVVLQNRSIGSYG